MTLRNNSGLTVHFSENGAIQCIETPMVRLSLKKATLFSRDGANIWLRKRTTPFESTPLTGPESPGGFALTDQGMFYKGRWKGVEYTCRLRLSPENFNWCWDVSLSNISDEPVEMELLSMQDVGLKAPGDGLVNEHYVAQYIERRILQDEKHGSVICCRQNMEERCGHPWMLMASLNPSPAALSDGMLFFGKQFRATGKPEALLSDGEWGEYAGESPVVALKESPFTLLPGDKHRSIIMTAILHDHPEATSEKDLERIPEWMAAFTPEIPETGKIILKRPATNLFQSAAIFPSENLNEEEINRFFGTERRHPEIEDETLLSFFHGDHNHVVLRKKELLTDRPHGHIMQAFNGFAPDERMVSTTAFASGVFNSHITQGNTNFNTLLSVSTSQFNQNPASGQRIFVDTEGQRYLLGIPSAFEMGLNHCRWIYKMGSHCFQIRTWTSKTTPQINLDFKVLEGGAVKLIVSHDFDPLNRWSVTAMDQNGQYRAVPGTGSMIDRNFPGAQFRVFLPGDLTTVRRVNENLLFSGTPPPGDDLFVLATGDTESFGMFFLAELCGAEEPDEFTDSDEQFRKDILMAGETWKRLSLNFSLKGDHPDIQAIGEILPWYGMNALIHFLTPYGLEQFGGAAWGTRDVSQGPVDLLITLEKYEEARKVLCTIFANQDPDGGWPQWWMFDRYRHIRAGEAHGDIYYWCIMAVGQYLQVTGDLTLLDEPLPYFTKDSHAEKEMTPLREHLKRLVSMITASFIPGTSLVPFGGGDWNDSLQPVSHDLAQRMISSWTVEMNYQAFLQYGEICKMAGDHTRAAEMEDICRKIRGDFQQYLVKDGQVAGYGLTGHDGKTELLLHPSDQKTGIKYSILPMDRGVISGIFTPEQAMEHQQLVETQLKGPDGARLMDRPLPYKGGIQEIFRRAESSTFFGREIGLMYVHEHIRYAESLAITGKADEFVKALRQAIPVGYREVVPSGDIRQANCYYSSSDAVFPTRYDADRDYGKIIDGKIALRGGWRVYSSGPGIYLAMVIRRLLGLRVTASTITFDPVMPFSFNGLKAETDLLGKRLTLQYSVSESNFSPKSIKINEKQVEFNPEFNPYRRGGSIITMEQFLNLTDQDMNMVVISM
jgi:cellobiose phosphorylase